MTDVSEQLSLIKSCMEQLRCELDVRPAVKALAVQVCDLGMSVTVETIC